MADQAVPTRRLRDLSAEEMLEIKAPKVIIVTDDGDKRGLRLGKTVFIDGREFLMPEETDVVVNVSPQMPMTITVTLFADVEFVEEPPAQGDYYQSKVIRRV